MLLWAYANGIFPMADPQTNIIDWYSPDPRGIIPLDAFHVPKNLAREVRKRRFEIRTDTAFEQVIRACAVDRSSENESWINERLIHAYCQLHDHGHALVFADSAGNAPYAEDITAGAVPLVRADVDGRFDRHL
jgi:leucyl/phenylalanyl-tRNA---protein transferase